MPGDIVPIFEAYSLTQASLLAGQLNEQGIQTFLDNDESPLDGLTAGDQTITVRVLPEQAEDARKIVEAFEAEEKH